MSATARLLVAVVGAALVAVALPGCGDGGLHARAESALKRVESMVTRLGGELDGNRLRNAQLIRQYATRVAGAKPELRELVGILEREATRDGTLYQGLASRLADVRAALPEPGAKTNAYAAVAEELTSLAAAADPSEFNRALGDPLNVLADLSDGMLPRVDAIAASASRRANNAADLGPGSQLVGNPHYGQWRGDSSGNSFWAWYGQYALLSSLMGRSRIGYGAWAGGRDYSYYHDYGRRNYTSPTARRQQARVESTARRKFSSQGRTFRSPYAKQRQGASSSIARQKFASSQSRGGQRRASRASVRGFGSGGSRGPRRGK